MKISFKIARPPRLESKTPIFIGNTIVAYSGSGTIKTMGRVIKIVLFVIIVKLILFSIIPLAAQKLIPYAGTFAYPDKVNNYHVPSALSVRANFDGIHYLLIAENGYTQYQQAFFPLYPLLIRFVTLLTGGNYLISGLLISRISFVCGLLLLTWVIRKTLPKLSYYALFLFMLTFPTSFFFSSVYTEGLFFFMVVSCIYMLQQKKILYASLIAAAASATRFIGIFLVAPILVTGYPLYFLKKKKWVMLLVFLIPFIGLVSYMVFLKATTGDPLYFLNVQPAFGAQRSNHIILLPQVYFRYFKIFFLSRINFQYLIAVLEFVVFNIMLVLTSLELYIQWKRKDSLWIGVGLFSLFNLILPTLTGTFSSIPRYSLLCISAFICLARIKSLTVRSVIISIFFVLQVVLFVFFTQGYFVS